MLFDTWEMEDAVLFQLLYEIYKRADKVESQHYPNYVVIVL